MKKKVILKKLKHFYIRQKIDYISQLNAIYKKKINLRFLYGKQFRSFMKHLESNYNIDSILRYILNNTDNNKSIKEGYKTVIKHVNDYINQYNLYNQDSLDSISKYITSLFDSNDKKLEDHYNKMAINTKGNKGIYLYECKNNSKEEYILNLFWEKITELPIAQNVLITNKETSSEEIQAFLHRAILCNYSNF